MKCNNFNTDQARESLFCIVLKSLESLDDYVKDNIW